MSALSLLFPLGATAAAGTVTYFTCVRPMRKDKGATDQQDMSHCSSAASTPSEDAGVEIRQLTEEVQLLRHELDLRADRDVEDLEHH